MKSPYILVAGLGLCPDDLAPGVGRAIAAAEVLAGGRRLLARFPNHPGRRVPLAAPLDQAIADMKEAWRRGERVVVLADGDPLLFGIGETLLKKLPCEALRFLPGVSALQAAAARLGRSWRDIPAVSLHGRNDFHPLFAALQQAGIAAVYTDAATTPAVLARTVRERGGCAFVLHVFEDMGGPKERTGAYALDEAEAGTFSDLNLTIVERTGSPEISPVFGLPDAALSRGDAVFTKAPARAVSLSQLALHRDAVLWDCGAGTGAVSLEAAVITGHARIVAVEGRADRFERLCENIKRTGLLTVRPVLGHMPERFEGLADPDRVFLGGGLGKGIKVLEAVWERLAPGGVLVANCALLDSLERARSFLEPRAPECSVTQLQASASAPLAGSLRLAADNPVFIVRAVKGNASGGQRGAAPLDSPPGG